MSRTPVRTGKRHSPDGGMLHGYPGHVQGQGHRGERVAGVRTGRGGPDPDSVESLADLVRELDLLRARAARGSRKARVSLDELAKRVDMPRSTVHAHISGVTTPPIDVLDKIVIALDATPHEQASWSEAWYRVAARPRTPTGPPPLPAPRQLPRDVSGFTGRADSLAALDQLLAGGGSAVAAISGTAGVGKTALAVRWAHRVAGQFPDGQLYLNLRGYDPTAPVPPAAALGIALRDLGVPGAAIRPTLGEQVSQYRTLLADRRVLVVLDNANSPEQVRDLLPGSSTCFVVVTSRDALTGLVARDGARRIDLDLLPVADALTLLRSLVGERVDDDTAAAHALADAVPACRSRCASPRTGHTAGLACRWRRSSTSSPTNAAASTCSTRAATTRPPCARCSRGPTGTCRRPPRGSSVSSAASLDGTSTCTPPRR